MNSDQISQYDNIYQSLLRVYQDDKKEYLQEADRLKLIIAKSSPPIPKAIQPYPHTSSPHFISKIMSKKEFARLVTHDDKKKKTINERVQERCSITDFKLSQNQKFIKNFLSPLTPYNGVLLFHSVGVGKTCASIGVAEQYLSDHPHKKVLVVLPSSLEDNYRRQIFDISKYDTQTGESMLCTGVKYPDMVLGKEEMTNEQIEKRVQRLISDRYQFVGYKELVNITAKILSKISKFEKDQIKAKSLQEQRIKELFSNRLIIIDEAHNLRMPTEEGKKQIANTMQHILSVSENIKLVLMSATPMFDTAKEIVWLLNLLLTNDKRPTLRTTDIFDDKGHLKGQTAIAAIEKASRGYVSFMRGENPFSFPLRLYPQIAEGTWTYPTVDNKGKKVSRPIKYLKLVKTPLSEEQKRVYKQLKGQVDISDDIEDEEADGAQQTQTTSNQGRVNALIDSLQVSNIRFPSLSDNGDIRRCFGKEGFDACFVTETRKGSSQKYFKYQRWCVERYGQFLHHNNLEQWSPKLKAIVDHIISSQGIILVYSQFYYSAIFPLMIALEHVGFQKYGGISVTSDISVKNMFSSAKRPPKYMVISGDKGVSANISQEVQVALSKANAGGEQIKVIIASKVGSEGFDLKRIREVHVVEPWYNLNRIEQVIGRAVRTCSHVDLPLPYRNVTVYMHATTYNEREESVDLKTYRVAEMKQESIMEVQRILKRNAIDCVVNMNALFYDPQTLNMRIDVINSQGEELKGYALGDRDESFLCDFRQCSYSCNVPRASSTMSNPQQDDTTFHPLFMIDDIDLYKKYISNAFKNVVDNTFSDIKRSITDTIDDVDMDVLAFALQEMVDTKHMFRNGKRQLGYLIYRGDRYIFQSANDTEVKLTIEEREQGAINRHVLGMQELFDHTKRVQPGKDDAPSASDVDSRRQKTSQISSKNTSPTIKVDHTIQRKRLIDLLARASTAKQLASTVTEDVMYAFVIDRLNVEDVQCLVNCSEQDEALGPLRTHFIYQTSLFHIDEATRVPRYYYHVWTDTFYSIRSQDMQMVVVGSLDRNKEDVKRILKTMKNAIQSARQSSPNVKGFVADAKDGSIQFKVKDSAKTKGYVCHKTSSLMLSELKNRILSLSPSASVDGGPHLKSTLCDVYELVLRSDGRDSFMRPFAQKLI